MISNQCHNLNSQCLLVKCAAGVVAMVTASPTAAPLQFCFLWALLELTSGNMRVLLSNTSHSNSAALSEVQI